MNISFFYDVLDIHENCSEEALYIAYQKKMEQFSEYAKIGPHSSFVTYPGGLRNGIWFYNVAYLSLSRKCYTLSSKEDKDKYKKLVDAYQKDKRHNDLVLFLLRVLYFLFVVVILTLWELLRSSRS